MQPGGRRRRRRRLRDCRGSRLHFRVTMRITDRWALERRGLDVVFWFTVLKLKIKKVELLFVVQARRLHLQLGSVATAVSAKFMSWKF